MKGERGGLDWLRPRQSFGAVAPLAHFADRGEQLEPLGWGYVTPLAFYVCGQGDHRE